jgi:hypothetical protein
MRFALLIVLTLVLGVGLLFLAKHAPVTAKAQSVQPFVLQRLVRVPDANGQLVFHKTELIARRSSDGATVLVESVSPPSGSSTAFVRKLTYLDGTSLSLFDTLKVKTTWNRMSSRDASRLQMRVMSPPHDCNSGKPFSFLRYDKVAEYPVAVIQGVLSKTYRITRWASPEFGCEDLYYTSELVDPDGAVVMLSLESKMTTLIKGEPDARLFDTGAAFEEVAPSEAESRLLASLNIEQDSGERSAARRKMDSQHSDAAGQKH